MKSRKNQNPCTKLVPFNKRFWRERGQKIGFGFPNKNEKASLRDTHCLLEATLKDTVLQSTTVTSVDFLRLSWVLGSRKKKSGPGVNSVG